MSENNKPYALSNSDEEIDLSRVIGEIIDYRWLIISVISLFTFLGLLYGVFATPIYKADTLIQVEKSGNSSIFNSMPSMFPTSMPVSSTEAELIKSRMIFGKTINELNLDTEVKEKFFPLVGRVWSKIVGNGRSEIAISRFSVPTSWLDQAIDLNVIDNDHYQLLHNGNILLQGKVGQFTSENGINLLVSEISAKPGTVFTLVKKAELKVINNLLNRFSVSDKGQDTGVLTLELTGSDPILIRNILDNISKEYLQQNVARKSEEAAKSLIFLKEQLPKIRANLDEAENKLHTFRQKNDSIDLSLEAKSILESTISVESKLSDTTFREAEVSKLYTKAHPAYQALLERRNLLEQEKNKVDKRINEMPKTQQEILRLTRDVQVGQEVYMQLLNKQQQLNINKASMVGYVRIIDPAVTELEPIKPKKALIVIIMAALGAMLSTGYVLLKSVLRKDIHNPEQLEERGINVYASIPLSTWQQDKDKELPIRYKKHNARANQLLAIGNPADLSIEAIRNLRTSLHFAMLEAKNNILMISGANPGIGKTFICANLAVVIAQSGQKILLIDSDMRKGYAHELIGFEQVGMGLSELLSGQCVIEKTIKKTDIPNMDFISRGRIPPNPSELLMHHNFTDLLKWASEHYDMVLIDTPPILAVTDAAIVGRNSGTSLLVARFAYSTVKDMEISIKRFEQNGIDIKGTILNAVVKKASVHYGYYNYAYGNDKNEKIKNIA